MRVARTKLLLFVSLFLIGGGWAAAQSEVGGPVPNWTVPAYRPSAASGGLSTMADVSPGVAFVAMQPCRVFDTRNAIGPYGGPRLLANTTRNFDIDSGPCTGIPAGVEAYSMNFGAIFPDGANSFITIWPAGTAQPLVSSINPIQGGVVANAAIVPAGTNGQISIFPNTGVHLYGDINGYFTDQYNPGVSFHAVSANVAPAIIGENTSTVADAVAIRGVITSTTPGASAAAVRGVNNGTAASGIGVWGSQEGSGFGVYGTSVAGYGVYGTSASGFGVVAGTGGSASNAAVWARNTSTGADASGVYGSVVANIDGIRNYGVFGETTSQRLGSAGVFGRDGGGVVAGTVTNAGVRGDSRGGVGVLGVTQDESAGSYSLSRAVQGVVVNSVGGVSGTLGYNGFNADGANYGVYSEGPAHVTGNLTVGGTISAAMKPFIQPHPHDPSKQIRYVSLEGPQSEVYFRGTAQVSRGVTRIAIPEDFRLVADGGTYSTLVTPVGAMASVAVLSEGEEGIVVQASRDVKVHYVVYAEREAMRNPEPIIENVDFRPEPDSDSLRFLPEPYRRLMIQNGTLKPDGTVNVETARRLGWDKDWEKRGRPAPQPTE